MFKQKKAISPMVATVLLIAFIIIIAILIWVWWGNIVREAGDKQSSQTAGQYSCQNEVDFTISEIRCVNVNEANDAISINIENKGTTRIDNFKAVIEDDTGEIKVIPTTDESINAGEAKQIAITHDLENTLSKVTLFPMIAREGVLTTCNEKQIVQPCPE